MFKKVIIPSLMFMVILITSAFQPQQDWRKFSPNSAGFTALMPTEPEEQTESVSLPIGQFPFRGFRAKSQSGVFTIGYLDIPTTSRTPHEINQLLDAVRDWQVNQVQGTLLSQRVTFSSSWGSFPGRLLTVKTSTGMLESHILIVNNRIYVATAINNPNTEAVQKYFTSIVLPDTKERPVSAGNSPPWIVKKSEGVVRGNAITLIRPIYPREAIAQQIQGKVEVELVIDEQGAVVYAKPISGNEALWDAAVSAAESARFKPTTLNNVPVIVQCVLTYNFTLN